MISVRPIGKFPKDKVDCIYDQVLANSDITVKKSKQNYENDKNKESKSPEKNVIMNIMQLPNSVPKGYKNGKPTANSISHKLKNITASNS